MRHFCRCNLGDHCPREVRRTYIISPTRLHRTFDHCIINITIHVKTLLFHFLGPGRNRSWIDFRSPFASGISQMCPCHGLPLITDIFERSAIIAQGLQSLGCMGFSTLIGLCCMHFWTSLEPCQMPAAVMDELARDEGQDERLSERCGGAQQGLSRVCVGSTRASAASMLAPS